MTGLKTLWEKEKMLVTNIFHNVFKRLFTQGHEKLGLCGKELTLYHTIQTFNNPEKRNLLKRLWEKEKMLVTSIFSFSNHVFYQSQKEFLFLSYIYFVVCKCFEPGPI